MNKEEASLERAALRETFNVLDVHDAGFMTWDVFRLLIKVRSTPSGRP